MPSWNSVLDEITRKRNDGNHALDNVRRGYLKKLHRHTKRNVIAYYSGWLHRPPQTPNLDIGDDDKNAFMTAVHKLDRTLGLDLILHTPGGNITATESLVDYLWQMFDKDIRVIVPQLAMSAGTMIACSAKSIVMGKQSSLGPIDPQFGGIAAQGVLDEFQMAIENIQQTPASAPLWQAIVGKYHPTFLLECMQAIDYSREMVRAWLQNNMFEGDQNAGTLAAAAVQVLSDHADTKTHSRHLSMAAISGIGLKTQRLEEDEALQDLVLTVHHAFMHTFAQTSAIKIIENHNGIATVLMGPQQVMPGQLILQPAQSGLGPVPMMPAPAPEPASPQPPAPAPSQPAPVTPSNGEETG